MGDFNVVRFAEERLGSTFNSRKASAFNSFIDAADLVDPPLGARRFTWVGWGELKLSKLDRFLICKDLLDTWAGLSPTVLDRCFSDHAPILLKPVTYDCGLFLFASLMSGCLQMVLKILLYVVGIRKVSQVLQPLCSRTN